MPLLVKGTSVIYGVDVSYYQGLPDWRQVYNAGIRFAFSKVSESTDYVNSTWAHNRAGMETLTGFVPGAYHFLRSTTDPAEQARHFAAAAGDLSKWAVMLDVEPITDQDGKVVSMPSAAQAKTWVTELKAKAGGHKVLGYFPRWYWRELGEPDLSFFDGLCGSEYVSGTGTAATLYTRVPSAWWEPYGGENVVTLQFSSSATVPGISGKVDVNAYRGTVDELRAALIGTTPAPKPAPPPAWPGRYLKVFSPMMHGSDVTWVQRRLGVHKHPVQVDGYYGPKTASAVKTFQKGAHLTVDGIVGRNTWTALAKP
jgi:lysozyme